MRNPVGIGSDKAQRRSEGEAVGASLPCRTAGRDALFVERDIELRLVDDTRADRPHISDLVTVPGANAVSRGRRQAAGGSKSPKRIDQVKVIVNVATINTVLRAKLIIKPNDVLAPVLRIVWLKRHVAGRIRVSENTGILGRQRVDRGNCFAVRRDALRGQYIVDDGAAGRCVGRCMKGHPRGAEVAAQFRRGGNSLDLWGRELSNPFPLLPRKEEQLLAKNRAAEVPPEVVEPKGRP